jgi:hypothetical protein
VCGRAESTGKTGRALVGAKIHEITVRLKELVYSLIDLPSAVQAGKGTEQREQQRLSVGDIPFTTKTFAACRTR